MDQLGPDEHPEPELTAEERAALPADTMLHRALNDRRVRLALLVGVPVLVALFVAAGIFAHSFAIARSVVVEGPLVLAPGSGTSVRVSYAEMDEYGLPHEIPFDRVQLEVCPATGTGTPAGATPVAGPACLPLGEVRGQGRGQDVQVDLTVPALPAGKHTVHIRIDTPERSVRYAFPATFDPEASEEPERRENGRVPATPLGRSGVVVDLVPLDGGMARGRTTRFLLRALGPEGDPYAGPLFLLPLGELARAGLPPSVRTDALGLAELSLRSELFEFRLAISTAEYPAIDPLEADVGLLPADVLDRTALLEVSFRPTLGGMLARGAADAPGDAPFVRAGGPLFAALDPAPRSPTKLFAEVWLHGRLLRLGSGASAGAPVGFPGFALPEGLVFVQLHRAGDPVDSVVGRHVWAGADGRPDPADVGALFDSLIWPAEDLVWVTTVRQRLDDLDPAAVERLGRYVLARRDPVWYPLGTLFDSRPADLVRVAALRDGVKTAMAWGIGALAVALLGIAVFLGVSAAQQARRGRRAAVPVPGAATAPGEHPATQEDREAHRGQHGQLLRIAAVLLIVAIGLAGIALLIWGMKQSYFQP